MSVNSDYNMNKFYPYLTNNGTKTKNTNLFGFIMDRVSFDSFDIMVSKDSNQFTIKSENKQSHTSSYVRIIEADIDSKLKQILRKKNYNYIKGYINRQISLKKTTNKTQTEAFICETDDDILNINDNSNDRTSTFNGISKLKTFHEDTRNFLENKTTIDSSIKCNWYCKEIHGHKALLYQLNKNEVLCLKEGEWLSDGIVNLFMKYIYASWNNDIQSKCFIINTHFYAKLSTNSFESASKWVKNVNIFEREWIFIPIHENKEHWILTVIYNLNKVKNNEKAYILYMDSMNTIDNKKYTTINDKIKRFLIYLWKQTNQKNSDNENILIKGKIVDVTQQDPKDGNCGVFLLKNMDVFFQKNGFNNTV